MNCLYEFCKSKLANKYVNSLLAKPFVILSGNSGTGKTRIATQLAEYLSTSLKKTDIKMEFKIGDTFGEGKRQWIVRKITQDVLYLSSDENQNRLRPLPFNLISEYITYIKANPNIQNLSSTEVRTTIGDLPNAEFDKYMYGLHATLILVAKEFISRQNKENQISKGIKNSLLIPVGADWTDNTKILGYYNPLADNGAGKYEKTDVFRFIERAGANPEIPFFLILDEMNLSHVERYFSDFLSKMELLDYKENSEPVFFDIPGYGKLELPKNLFITGTVNIDETTYMFSPKVLDRANVIEFKPEMSEVLESLTKDASNGEQKSADDGVAEGFMQLANEVRSGTIPSEVQQILEGIKPILESFYKELEKCGFEFAYRTVKEIRLYAIAAYKTAEGEKPTAAEIADIQILQKILPKIHGNKKQIGNLLDELEKLCTEHKLEQSGKKIQQMKDKLSRFQYANFI